MHGVLVWTVTSNYVELWTNFPSVLFVALSKIRILKLEGLLIFSWVAEKEKKPKMYINCTHDKFRSKKYCMLGSFCLGKCAKYNSHKISIFIFLEKMNNWEKKNNKFCWTKEITREKKQEAKQEKVHQKVVPDNAILERYQRTKSRSVL